jgi:CubicO group peptidase (beta-lactamase class C family)
MVLALLAGCRTPVTDPPEWRDLVAYVEWGLEEWDVPGASIAIVDHGTIYAAGLGVRSLETGDPVTLETQFRAASVTKMHTAMAMLTLIEDGLVDPTVAVTEQIPDFALAPPYQASSMTLDELLTHSSGIEASGEVTTCDAVDPDVLEPFVREDGATWVQWTPPKVFFSYANIGFAIAGLAEQAVTGEPYTDLMQERVLGPLGMEHTTFDPRDASEDQATGHTLDPATRELVAAVDLFDRGCATEWAYGGLITTASDLARTVEVLLSKGAPVMDETTYEGWVNGGWKFSSSSRYAYGLSSADKYLDGHRMLQHGGAIDGFNSLLAAAPDDEWGIVILVNADHSTTFPAEPFTKPTSLIFLKAMSLYLGTELDPVEPSIRPVEEWSRFTGNYVEQFTYGDLSVYQEGSDLWFHIADPDPRDVKLEPYSRNTFRYDRPTESPYQSSVSFSMSDDDTTVDWVVLAGGIASTAPATLKDRAHR